MLICNKTVLLYLVFLMASLFSAELALIPIPVSMTENTEQFFLTGNTEIQISAGMTEQKEELVAVASLFISQIENAVGAKLAVVENSSNASSVIRLSTSPYLEELGDEGYQLDVKDGICTINALKPEGIYRGLTTLRQLLPWQIESSEKQSFSRWEVSGVTIEDKPRYGYRSYMLDPARNWLTVDQIKTEIDRMTLYKFNILHLHLTDDQGWRIEINGWPKLTTIASDNDAGFEGADGPGSGPRFYTQEEFKEIVAYADARYIEVVPEVDFPGHTNSMLYAYPEELLGASSHPKWSGIGVHPSEFDVHNENSWKLIADVMGQVHEMTNSKFFHIGGDEADGITHSDYVLAMDKAKHIADSLGDMILIGWDEMAGSNLEGERVYAQYWSSASNTAKAAQKGMPIIMSPADRIYLDIVYSFYPTTPSDCGLTWIKGNDVKDAYDWDPTTISWGLTEDDIAGIEAPLWGETIENQRHLEILTYPRLLGAAEISWSPKTGRNWEEYKDRLAKHALRMKELGIAFYESPLVPWDWEGTSVVNVSVSQSTQIQVYKSDKSVSFDFPQGCASSITIYSIRGQMIKKLHDGDRKWFIENIPAGFYVAHIKTGLVSTEKKILINR